MELGRDKTVAEIISRLKSAKAGDGVIKVEGTWGSFARLLTAYISEKTARPILYMCPHIDDADKAADDLHTFGGERIDTFGAWEGEEDLADATDEIRAERLRVVSKVSCLIDSRLDESSTLAQFEMKKMDSCFRGNDIKKDNLRGRNGGNFFITAPVQALCQPIPSPEAIEASCLRLEVEREASPEQVVEWLVESGFERVERIDLPGQFAHRGGIVDIYAPLVFKTQDSRPQTQDQTPASEAEAVRIEFFGDSIESIRGVNLDTQRSTQRVESVGIVSAVCGTKAEQRELFVNILPKDTIIIFEGPGEIEEVAEVFLGRAENTSRLYNWGDIYKAADNFTQLHICRFATGEPVDFLRVDIKSVQQFQHKATSVWAGHKEALAELVQEAKQGKEVLLYCESSAELKRVGEIIEDINKEIPPRFKLL